MRRGRSLPRARYSKHFLREWRLHRGLTQEALADLIGMTHASIQRMETSQQPIQQPVLDELARALKVSRGTILDEPPKN